MAGFDVSDAAARVNNPFQVVQQLAQTQNALNENKMFQAKALAGQYLSKSIGPNGQPDMNSFSQALAADPRTAPYAPEILEAGQTIRRGGIAASQGQQDLAASGLKNVQQITSTYGNSSQNPDPDLRAKENVTNVLGALGKLGQTNIADPDLIAHYVGSGDFIKDIRAATIGGAGGAGASDAMAPTPTQIDTGSTIQTVQPNRFTGQSTPMTGPSASIPTTLTPAQKASRVPTVNPQGVPKTVPLASLSTPTGEPTAAGEELPTGLAPGKSEAIASTAKTSADQYNAVSTAYNGSTNREALLHEMLSAQGDFRSGPGASKWSGWVTEANRVLGTHFSPTATPSQQVFSKITEQLAAQQRSVLGMAPTDEQTNMSRLMNPNNEYSPEANKEVGAMLLGNEKLLQLEHAVQQDWTKNGGTPDQYQSVIDRFKPIADPRIFQEMYMTPAQRTQMYKNMSPSQLQTFNRKKAYISQQMQKYGIEP
jgi:hypothetical protein